MINSVLQWEKQAVREVTQAVQTHTDTKQQLEARPSEEGPLIWRMLLTEENPPNKSFTPAVPNLFGTKAQFHGRQFFYRPG